MFHVSKYLRTGKQVTNVASFPGSKGVCLRTEATDFLKLAWASEDGVGSYLDPVHHIRRACTYFGTKIILIEMAFLDLLFMFRENQN